MSCFDVGSQVTLFTAASTLCGVAVAWYFYKTPDTNLVTLGKIDRTLIGANPVKPGGNPDLPKAA